MSEWLRANDVLVGWLSAISVLLFIGSLVAVPWLLTRIPADYFVRRRHLIDRSRYRHPALHIAMLALKNLCGLVLLVAGIVMLVIPGQGILTILAGLLCLDFPGKFALEQRLVRQRPLLRTINWIRAKAHRPPLAIPTSIDDG